MKQIKFRQFVNGNFHYWGYLETDGRTYFELPVDQRPIVPSNQFTGLTDKNGKEIYEGDIVQMESINNPQEVRFHRGCFCTTTNGGVYYSGMDFIMPKRVEVIGNIYANKEKP